jgi:hypothetical protein
MLFKFAIENAFVTKSFAVMHNIHYIRFYMTVAITISWYEYTAIKKCG